MFSYVFGCILIVAFGVPLQVHSDTGLPNDRTVIEYLSTFGLSNSKYEELCEKARRLIEKGGSNYGKDFPDDYQDKDCPVCQGRIILDGDTIDSLLQELNTHHSLTVIATISNKIWDRKLKYYLYIKGDDDDDKKELVKEALKEIEEKTCIEFEREDELHKADIVFTTEKFSMCGAFIGRVSGIQYAQPIYLGRNPSIGTILALTALTLGMVPQHRREDRNNYIEWNYISTPPRFSSSFFRKGFVKFPYDFQSVTHAPAKQKGGNPTTVYIETTSEAYEFTIGQASELSFYDAKTLNYMYCTECDQSTDCFNGGYRIIEGCGGGSQGCCENACICPDGITGYQCDGIADGDDEDACKSNVLIASSPYAKNYEDDSGIQCIEVKNYKPGDRETWLIKNGLFDDPSCRIRLWFEGKMDIPPEHPVKPACNNWVEVRLCGAHVQGERFCGENRKEIQFTDKDDHKLDEVYTNSSILINFRSFINADESNKGDRSGGFKLCFERRCGYQVPMKNVLCPVYR